MREDENKNDWYPFVIPEKLDQDSPANIGKLVLDAPAGKHGNGLRGDFKPGVIIGNQDKLGGAVVEVSG